MRGTRESRGRGSLVALARQRLRALDGRRSAARAKPTRTAACFGVFLSPRHVHTYVRTDGAYLLLAADARCVRGRSCRWIANLMAARRTVSSSLAQLQATTTVLLPGRELRRPVASAFSPFICGALPWGHCALPPGKSGALLSPL